MDHLTQLYKSKVEDLQKQLQILEEQLNYLNEEDVKSRLQKQTDGTNTWWKDPKTGSLYSDANGENIITSTKNVKGESVPLEKVNPTDRNDNIVKDIAYDTFSAISDIALENPKASLAVGAFLAPTVVSKIQRYRNFLMDVATDQAKKDRAAAIERRDLGVETGRARRDLTQAELARVRARSPIELQRDQERLLRAQEEAKVSATRQRVATTTEPDVIKTAQDTAAKTAAERTSAETEASWQRARTRKPVLGPDGNPIYTDPVTGTRFNKEGTGSAYFTKTKSPLESPTNARVSTGRGGVGAIALEPQDPMSELLGRAKEGIELTGKDVKAATSALRRGATTPLPGSKSPAVSSAAQLGAGIVGAMAGEYVVKPALEKAGVFDATEKYTRKGLESMPSWAAQVADPALAAAQFILNPPVGEMLVQGAQLTSQKEFESAVKAGKPSAVRVTGPKF